MDRPLMLQNEKRIYENSRTYITSFALNRWLAIRNETLGGTVIFLAAIAATIQRDTIGPGGATWLTVTMTM